MKLNNDVYTINDSLRAHNKTHNIIDYCLCWMYAVISMANAILGIKELNMNVYEINNGKININLQGIETILLLIVNFIILFRLNIKLAILRKDLEQQIRIEEIAESNIIKINIHAIDKRIKYIHYSYIVECVIFIMNIIYKKEIETSLAVLVILPIFLTLYNDITDVEKNRCDAKEKITFEYSTIQKEKNNVSK